MNKEKLNYLQTKLSHLKNKLETLFSQKNDIQKDITSTSLEVDKTEKEIKTLMSQPKSVVVTDHAVIRYIERVYKLNLEDLKQEILTDDVLEAIEKFNSGKFPVTRLGRNITLVARNKTIVTVIDQDECKRDKKISTKNKL